jgi:hypothetical protein
MKLRRQQPIGTQQTLAFVCPGGLRPVDLPVYPPSPRGEALRALRVDLRIGLREAATAMGLSAVELGEIERGVSVPEEEASWAWLEAALRERSPH